MSCICQQCKKDYRIDLNIPDRIWERIKPVGEAYGNGALCGPCIMNKLEAYGKYGVIHVDDDAFELSI